MSENKFNAVIFDLDGVITKTAVVHSLAWKKMFDDFLRERAEKTGEKFIEFSHEKDYLTFVDGKPRYKGVESFLKSRHIDLPYGNADDSPDKETICGIGNRKNQAFNEILKTDGVQVYDSSVRLIKNLLKAGIKVGVASSSKNCVPVLKAAEIFNLVETVVDGVVSAKLKLKGKPEPDIFTTACDNLKVSYDKAIVVEDAISGVQAGKKGNFGLVIGVARENNNKKLLINGADIVVNDLEEINIDKINDWFNNGLENDMWSLTYHDYDKEKERTRESLLSVGNGYFGTRGAMEESLANKINYPGTYIAGVYNKLKSKVQNKDIYNEDFVNCPNWTYINFNINDEVPADINDYEIIDFYRNLNFKTGVLSKNIIIRDKKARETQIISKRIASMDNPHIAAIEYSIKPLNYSEDICISSGIIGNIINSGVERYKQLNQKHLLPVHQEADKNFNSILVKTSESDIKIAMSSKINVSINGNLVNPEFNHKLAQGNAFTDFHTNINKNDILKINKIISIYTSKDKNVEDAYITSKNEISKFDSFDEVFISSKKQWDKIWDKIDISVEGDRLAQKLLRLHLYHIMVTTSEHNKDIDFGIPARGLHGEAYRGHIFWDELFILPFYDIHFQEAAKSVLLYRYRRLDEARNYAKEYGYKGAMFPWQSASSGCEETQILHLNPITGKWGDDYSSLQRHVSLAIAYNIWQYFNITDDVDFINNYGLELLLEICRFWASKANYNKVTGRYEIDKVMGPDEFHEKYPDKDNGGLKDNAYTNIMLAWLLNKTLNLLDVSDKSAKQKVFNKINLNEAELKNWEDIKNNLNIIISPDGIISQFDGYFNLKELDWEAYKNKYGNIYRMDRILKSEGKSADDYKVAKQADTLMIFYNLDKNEIDNIFKNLNYDLPDDYLLKNLQYYLKRTSHGSTLSRIVHSYLANLIDNKSLSIELYYQALTSDYSDVQGGTTGEGIHTGVMAGTVLITFSSFAGVNLKSKILNVKPNLPDKWRKISFNFNFKGIHYYFTITKDFINVKPVTNKNNIEINICDETHHLTSNQWNKINY